MNLYAAFLNLCADLGQAVLDRWDRFIGPYRPTPDAADRAPGTYTTWPCPDCGERVPVTATIQRVAVVQLDPTDIHAHQLTHQEQP